MAGWMSVNPGMLWLQLTAASLKIQAFDQGVCDRLPGAGAHGQRPVPLRAFQGIDSRLQQSQVRHRYPVFGSFVRLWRGRFKRQDVSGFILQPDGAVGQNGGIHRQSYRVSRLIDADYRPALLIKQRISFSFRRGIGLICLLRVFLRFFQSAIPLKRAV